MNLAPEQTTAVKSWIAAGASIADVQKRLNDEFKVSLTYMDTRFLIDDLGLDIKAPPPPKPATPPGGATGPGPAASPAVPAANTDAELVDDAGYDDLGDDPEGAAASLDQGGGAAGAVKVDVDRVMRPGTVVSGTVTFSDGKNGKWALDQYGRLMFESTPPGYRPAPADLQAFQRELSAVLQRQGY